MHNSDNSGSLSGYEKETLEQRLVRHLDRLGVEEIMAVDVVRATTNTIPEFPLQRLEQNGAYYEGSAVLEMLEIFVENQALRRLRTMYPTQEGVPTHYAVMLLESAELRRREANQK